MKLTFRCSSADGLGAAAVGGCFTGCYGDHRVSAGSPSGRIALLESSGWTGARSHWKTWKDFKFLEIDLQVLHDPAKYRMESISGSAAKLNARSPYTVSSSYGGIADGKGNQSRSIGSNYSFPLINGINCATDWWDSEWSRVGRIGLSGSDAQSVVVQDAPQVDHQPPGGQRLRSVPVRGQEPAWRDRRYHQNLSWV